MNEFSLDASSKKKWKRLFDGKTLQGRHTIPGDEWKVEDGAIVVFPLLLKRSLLNTTRIH